MQQLLTAPLESKSTNCYQCYAQLKKPVKKEANATSAPAARFLHGLISRTEINSLVLAAVQTQAAAALRVQDQAHADDIVSDHEVLDNSIFSAVTIANKTQRHLPALASPDETASEYGNAPPPPAFY